MHQVIKNILHIILFIQLAVACNTISKNTPLKQKHKVITIIGPKNIELKAKLAITEQQQAQGLSGIKEHEFSPKDAMLFYYQKEGARSFWMPDTYFDLDIIYLNKEFKVIEIARGIKAHPGHKEPPPITRVEPIWSMHVLEVKSNTEVSKLIKRGMYLKPKNINSLLEKVKDTRP